MPNFDELKKTFAKVHELICAGKIISAKSLGVGGISAAISEMCIGNDIGFHQLRIKNEELRINYGTLIVEATEELDFELLGETISEPVIKFGDEKISLDEIKRAYTEPLEKIFPTQVVSYQWSGISEQKSFGFNKPKAKVVRPRVFIPVFPGTNCEYDSAKVWRQAGAEPKIFVVRNLTPSAVAESVDAMIKEIKAAQIIMLPGGFSGGDEPDGSLCSETRALPKKL